MSPDGQQDEYLNNAYNADKQMNGWHAMFLGRGSVFVACIFLAVGIGLALTHEDLLGFAVGAFGVSAIVLILGWCEYSWGKGIYYGRKAPKP